jgi:hypothetical protein
MAKYRVTGKVHLVQSANDEGSLQSIECFIYGDTPKIACENLINGDHHESINGRIMFVGVETEVPSHFVCPITDGFLSFIEDDS